jgi:hypothetical protein
MTANILDKYERAGSLTSAGRAWLTAALDPFHDLEIRCDGLPDSDVSNVIIEKIVQTVQVSAPAGLAAGTNWDCHVFNLPEGIPLDLYPGIYNEGFTSYWNQLASNGTTGVITDLLSANLPTIQAHGGYNNEGVLVEYGLLNIVSVNTGAPTVPNLSMTPATTISVVDITPPGNLQSGKRRLIAMGYEIHNTTATLYKQGTITAYRMPNTEVDAELVGLLDPVAEGSYSSSTNNYSAIPYPTTYKCATLPPSQVNEAMTYTDARQWDAEEGAYVVCRFDINRNQLRQNTMSNVAFLGGDNFQQNVATSLNLAGRSALATGQYYDANVLQSGNFVGVTSPQAHFSLPFHTSGVFLSGLSPQSTFAVTLRTFWEYAPSYNDVNGGVLVPLAQSSPPCDPLAIELYDRVSQDIPVAVKVSMNAEGDFWDLCLGALATAAPAVGNFLLPGAGGVAGTAASAYLKNQQKQRNANSALDSAIKVKKAEKMGVDSRIYETPATLSREMKQLKLVQPKKKNKAKASVQRLAPVRQKKAKAKTIYEMV